MDVESSYHGVKRPGREAEILPPLIPTKGSQDLSPPTGLFEKETKLKECCKFTRY
jgi:hypothetical protein